MDIDKLLSENTKLRALYNDPNATKRNRKTALQYLRRQEERKAKKAADKLRLLNREWKRKNRLTDTGFREKYRVICNEEISVWYKLIRVYGKSRVAPLEEWIASGIDKMFDRSSMFIVRKDTKRDFTIDNILVISATTTDSIKKKTYTILYDPLEAASGGALEGIPAPLLEGVSESVRQDRTSTYRNQRSDSFNPLEGP